MLCFSNNNGGIIPSGVATIYACMLKHTHNFQQKKSQNTEKCKLNEKNQIKEIQSKQTVRNPYTDHDLSGFSAH